MPLKLTTYYHGKDIPDLPGNNTFHSKELFQIYEATPGYSPLLIVAIIYRISEMHDLPQGEEMASFLSREAMCGIWRRRISGKVISNR